MKHIFTITLLSLLISNNSVSAANPLMENWQVFLLPCSHNANGDLEFLFEPSVNGLKVITINANAQKAIDQDDFLQKDLNTFAKKITEALQEISPVFLAKNVLIEPIAKYKIYLPVVLQNSGKKNFIWERADLISSKQIDPADFGTVIKPYIDQIKTALNNIYFSALFYIKKVGDEWHVYLKADPSNNLGPELVPATNQFELSARNFTGTYSTSPIIALDKYFWRVEFIDIEKCPDQTNWIAFNSTVFNSLVKKDQTIFHKTIKMDTFNTLTKLLPEVLKSVKKDTDLWQVYILPCAHDENGILHFLLKKGSNQNLLMGISAGDNISINPVDLREQSAENKLIELGFKKNQFLLGSPFEFSDDKSRTKIYFPLVPKIEPKENFVWVKDIPMDQITPIAFKLLITAEDDSSNTIIAWCKKAFLKAEQFYQRLEFFLKKQDADWYVFFQQNMQPITVTQEKSTIALASKKPQNSIYRSDVFVSKFSGYRLWQINFLDGSVYPLTTFTGVSMSKFTSTYGDIIIGDKKIDKDVAQAIYNNLPTAIQEGEKLLEKSKQQIEQKIENPVDDTSLVNFARALLMLY